MSQYTFKFIISNVLAEHSLTLLSFSGQENISALFNFELSLRCDDLALDEDEILNKECRLEIYYQAGNIAPTKPMRVIHGMVNEFEDVEYYPDHTLYRANMVPRVWQLGLFDTNEVYLNQSISETLTVILEEAGFISSQDFRFTLSRTYRKWPFRLQYKETHLAYLQRIIEREGIYYYFEPSDTGEVMVFCDYNQALPPIAPRGKEAGAVNYQTGGALNVNSKANTLNSIICKRQSLPKKVTLRDFNDETPSLDIRGEFLIDPKGMGEINLYGLNIASPEEGQQLAEIHANGYLCRHKSYLGEGDIAVLSAGHTFTIENHPRPAFNQTPFLVENVYHEGANLVEGNSHLSHAEGAQSNYLNSFSALSAALEFVPQRQTVTPEIKGTLNAVIDTEAETDYAELDDSGRYKIKLPFDRKDKDGGKASHWVRMMQPYGGGNEGMHFPLRKGTRVLLGFIGGDPDRPFISGTISDSGDQQSIVTAENQTNNLIKTASGNKIELEDKEGKNRIKLQTGDNTTYMHLGSPNHPGDGFVVMSKGIERKEVTGGKQITRVTINYLNSSYATASGGASSISSISSDNDIGDDDLFNEQSYFKFPIKSSRGDGVTAVDDTFTAFEGTGVQTIADYTAVIGDEPLMDRTVELSGYYLIERTVGDKYIWERGNEYEFNSPGDTRFQFGADKEIVMCQGDHGLGIYAVGDISNAVADGANVANAIDNELAKAGKVNGVSSGDPLFLYRKDELQVQDNILKNQKINDAVELLKTLNKLREGLVGYQSYDYNGTLTDGYKNYTRYPVALSEEQWNDLLDNKSQLRVAKHNTFNIQNGNIFDFGGYWNYDLGNSYAEVHGKQDTEINQKEETDIAAKPGPHWQKINGKKLVFEQKGDEQVEKVYSNQYSYTKGDTIEVQKGDAESQHYGNSYEHTETDLAEEWTYTSDKRFGDYSKTSYSKSGGRVTESRFYYDEVPTSYEIVSEPSPGTKFSFKGDYLPTLEMSMEIDVGETKLSTHIGVMSNSIEMDAMLMKNSVSISSCPLKTEIEIGPAGLKKFETNLPGMKVKAAMIALKMEQKAAVEMDAHKLVLQNKLMDIRMTKLVSIFDDPVELSKKNLALESTLLKLIG
jgi:type VI secretion system VgrG family protein